MVIIIKVCDEGISHLHLCQLLHKGVESSLVMLTLITYNLIKAVHVGYAILCSALLYMYCISIYN